MGKVNKFCKQIKKYKIRNIIIYFVLRIAVILVMIDQFCSKNYDNVFLCGLTLILFMIPSIIEKRFNIEVPDVLEANILLFIFAAQILGEIKNYYTTFPHWDTMLHTVNGFLMAAIGFSLVNILNNSEKFHMKLSPLFVALVGFCFSMTIGVLWEFFEFSMDVNFKLDMQKDAVISRVSSNYLNEYGLINNPIIDDIECTKIIGKVNGEQKEVIIPGGYLDIGIYDTMQDLIVNCIGAVTFSVLGVFYIRDKKEYGLVKHFIPVRKRKIEK